MGKLVRLSLLVFSVFALTACNLGTQTKVSAVGDGPALTLLIQAQNETETFNAVGQIINFNYSVMNRGETSLAGPVVINDPKKEVACPGVNTVGNLNDSLDTNELITCSHTYLITQADLDAGKVTVSASATVGGVQSNQGTTTLVLNQNRILTLSQSANPTSYNQAGQTISYIYIIKNSGKDTLTGPFSIMDSRLSVACAQPASGQLAPNEEMTCTAIYAITAADMTVNSLTNTAMASGAGNISNPATVTITNSVTSQTPKPTQKPGNYSTGTTIQHQVVEGEWLIQIARCYGTDYAAIRQANPQIVDPNRLKIGITVSVPNVGSVGKSYGPPCVVFHQVQGNETWNSIAAQYNADVLVLQEANLGALATGRMLRVPKNSAGTIKYSTPVATTTANPAPIIYNFTVDSSVVSVGDAITLRWTFSGQSGVSARITRTNPDGSQSSPYGGSDLAAQGTLNDPATSAGTVTYVLVVNSAFGGTTSSSVVVTVRSK